MVPTLNVQNHFSRQGSFFLYDCWKDTNKNYAESSQLSRENCVRILQALWGIQIQQKKWTDPSRARGVLEDAFYARSIRFAFRIREFGAMNASYKVTLMIAVGTNSATPGWRSIGRSITSTCIDLLNVCALQAACKALKR